MRRIRVSRNRRYLAAGDGSPFFYLGDTAWELFHRLSISEADRYLYDRAAKGFTVIQAVVLAEFDGLTVANAAGDLPLENQDPCHPNEAYFDHVDRIVSIAERYDLTIGMLPTWGDKWNRKWGAGPEVFTPENAAVYGEWLGRRYASASLIWILGGDRPVENETHRAIIERMAEGLRAGDGGNHLITFHPMGGNHSADPWHDAAWLDFNMIQSGHSRNRDNYKMIDADYARTPVKPCIDAEPGYEDHPAGFNIANGYLDDWDCRKSAYWGLFAGGHGHIYGCHDIWQFFAPGRAPITSARKPWYEAIHLPGSTHVGHARALMLSRPYFRRVPDQSLLASENEPDVHHVRATRAEDGSFAMVYVPAGKTVEVDTTSLSGASLSAHWFDPRTRIAQKIGDRPHGEKHAFTPPPGGPDWVLVLDDRDRGFPPPGQGLYPDRDSAE